MTFLDSPRRVSANSPITMVAIKIDWVKNFNSFFNSTQNSLD